MNIENIINDTFVEVFTENNPDVEIPTLSKDLVLLDSGLDSLGFAVLVVNVKKSWNLIRLYCLRLHTIHKPWETL